MRRMAITPEELEAWVGGQCKDIIEEAETISKALQLTIDSGVPYDFVREIEHLKMETE